MKSTTPYCALTISNFLLIKLWKEYQVHRVAVHIRQLTKISARATHLYIIGWRPRSPCHHRHRIFQADVMAIQEAMVHLDTSEHHDIDIIIFSDSQVALRAL